MNADQMTYGVEIECYIPQIELTRRAWRIGGYHSGAQIPSMPIGWNAQSDGSLSQPPAAGYVGVEIVSPILRGADGLTQLKTVLATLSEMGARVNRSTGLHVHVGTQGFTVDDAAVHRLSHLISHLEPALWATTGSRWREQNSRYCRSVKRSYQFTALRAETLSGSALTQAAASAAYDRYHAVNFANLRGARKTIEFRLFAGTTNFIKIVGHIETAIGITQKALLSNRKPVAWDATRASKGLTRKSTILTEVARLYATLGWTKALNMKPMGIIADADTHDAAMKMGRTMARKYEQAVAAEAA